MKRGKQASPAAAAPAVVPAATPETEKAPEITPSVNDILEAKDGSGGVKRFIVERATTEGVLLKNAAGVILKSVFTNAELKKYGYKVVGEADPKKTPKAPPPTTPAPAPEEGKKATGKAKAPAKAKKEVVMLSKLALGQFGGAVADPNQNILNLLWNRSVLVGEGKGAAKELGKHDKGLKKWLNGVTVGKSKGAVSLTGVPTQLQGFLYAEVDKAERTKLPMSEQFEHIVWSVKTLLGLPDEVLDCTIRVSDQSVVFDLAADKK